MAVQEGEDAALTCRATGNPLPRVTWKKEDGDFILIRKQGSRDLMKGIYVQRKICLRASTLMITILR